MKRSLPLIAIVAAAAFASCSSSSYPTGRTYPNGTPYPTYPSTGGRGDDGVVVTRDGTVIDRNGRVIGNTRNMPPGQAKKIYGSKSARAYAPGQRKKAGNYGDGRYYDNDDRYDNDKKWKNKGKGKGKKH